MVAFAGLAQTPACFAQTAGTLEEQMSQLEASWAPGNVSKEYEYFARAGAIGADLSAHDRKTADSVAPRLLSNLLVKEIDSPEAGAVDLYAKSNVARFMLANRSDSAEVRRVQLAVLARLLGQVRQEGVTGYAPRPVYMNLAPPPGPGLRLAGMSPDAIADPTSREKYKAAIRENQESNRLNERQEALKQMAHELSARVVESLRREAASGLAAGVVEKLVVDARLTDTEKANVIRALEVGEQIADR